MSTGRRFTFDDPGFRSEVAHGGHGRIRTSRVFRGGEVSHCHFVDLTVVPAGSEIGGHTHEHDNHELYVIVSGRGRMELDGAIFDVGPGDVVMNQPGGTHGLKNVSDADLRIVVVEVGVKAEPR
ncbi:MAG TPA: cupin domain-containing protein [Candidatus Polarisedimenticolaceae bacterium]|nr:cupin domain-containing protein [Candidatus Polarisedimenticolaceae bacterium]